MQEEREERLQERETGKKNGGEEKIRSLTSFSATQFFVALLFS